MFRNSNFKMPHRSLLLTLALSSLISFLPLLIGVLLPKCTLRCFLLHSVAIMISSSLTHQSTLESVYSLFVGNLNRSISVDILRDVFKGFGRLCDVFLPKTSKYPKKPAYAFVRYADPGSAHKPKASSDGMWLFGQRIVIWKVNNRACYSPSTQSNMPTTCLSFGQNEAVCQDCSCSLMFSHRPLGISYGLQDTYPFSPYVLFQSEFSCFSAEEKSHMIGILGVGESCDKGEESAASLLKSAFPARDLPLETEDYVKGMDNHSHISASSADSASVSLVPETVVLDS